MIPFNDLKRGFLLYKEEYEKKALDVLNSGWYVLGQEVKQFELEFGEKIGARFVIGVDNGLNAIALGIKALNIGHGDEVILQSNSYIATVLAVSHNRAKPILVEPDEYYNLDVTKLENALTEKTKAVMVTHLYGQASNMEPIKEFCLKHNLFLLEDCAQSHFAQNHGQNTGTFGTLGFFSFYPTKNLGAYGDGGAIITDDNNLADKLLALRNYGSKEKYYNDYIGYNARLDEMQAGLLRIKLSHIEQLNEERSQIAQQYLKKINNPRVLLPSVRKGSTSVWHLFVIQCKDRDSLKQYMLDKDIKTDIHYPVPPHLSKAYGNSLGELGDFPIAERYANTTLSLPLFNGMTEDEVEKVINAINEFGGQLLDETV